MQTSIQINTCVVGKIVESESDEEVIDEAEESFLAEFTTKLERSTSSKRMKPNCADDWIASLKNRM